MTSTSRSNADQPQNTVTNDLFDYDAGLDDILKEFEQPATTTTQDNRNQKKNKSKPAGDDVLGIDEEVNITKKRTPIPKLDENRLLSENGILKLRKTAKTKLKFKGKGHEFSDAVRLLTFYQLWLDDLFPRAKFADGLSMIEKLGHTKRMQIMRKEWISEGKPGSQSYDTEIDPAQGISPRRSTLEPELNNNPEASHTDIREPDGLGDNPILSIFGGDGRGVRNSNRSGLENEELFVSDDDQAMPDIHPNNVPDDMDDLDAILAENEQTSNPNLNPAPRQGNSGDVPDEIDDLDAILGESEPTSNRFSKPGITSSTQPNQPPDDDYENDWEAFQEFGG
ncbi:chromosome segregation in meiosis- protein [Myotisia sp. PD_48]|nr:chromosome segregation in meiosis- protein [Myotisia sp. PD_48]